ncbi:hypothetical protein DHEL01_v208418 [Diaporthe helianthi]|uniref:RING-type domain-containing protein n=1 Tax=Diaporthe helianthi TaxID=158607 RepID=A0A2P5HSF4_DIAHE|nr:hypothetical protein DHEL01_v208418 [Diaporthe helianthi]
MALNQLELESLLVEVENPNYIPCPRISLSLDAGKLGACGICHDSQLLLRSQNKGLDDNTVAILPCGHIAGYKCLKSWFEYNQCCPFCRLPMNYQLCPHSSRLIKPLTRENLFSTPDTLAVGGSLPPQCVDCSVETDASVHKYLLGAMLDHFKSLRAEYNAETHEGKKIDLKFQLIRIKKRISRAIDELAAFPARAQRRW